MHCAEYWKHKHIQPTTPGGDGSTGRGQGLLFVRREFVVPRLCKY